MSTAGPIFRPPLQISPRRPAPARCIWENLRSQRLLCRWRHIQGSARAGTDVIMAVTTFQPRRQRQLSALAPSSPSGIGRHEGDDGALASPSTSSLGSGEANSSLHDHQLEIALVLTGNFHPATHWSVRGKLQPWRPPRRQALRRMQVLCFSIPRGHGGLAPRCVQP